MKIEGPNGNEFPKNKARSFQNYLVAVENNNDCQFNFTFKRGDKGALKLNKPLIETKIEPEGAEVRRAVLWYWPNNAQLTFIELFDKDGRVLLSV